MFGISGFELLIIVVLVLVIFGPDKLPELARTVGRAMNMFKRAQQDMEHVIRAEMYSSDSAAAKAKQEGGSPADATPEVEISKAATIWAATDEDDEEEDEE